MNNNFLLESAIRNNPVCFDRDDILIDEFFQIIKTDIDNNNYVTTIVYRPLNYQHTKIITSHRVGSGKNFHNRSGINILPILPLPSSNGCNASNSK